MKNIELPEMLKGLEELSANDLLTLQNQVTRHIYAKGVKDYLQNSVLGRQVEEIMKLAAQDGPREFYCACGNPISDHQLETVGVCEDCR